jgi:hypothetical protein
MSTSTRKPIVKDFPAGSVIFSQGGAGENMYVIERGSVEIHRTVDDWTHLLAVLTPGDFFGEMAIVSQRPRSATAIVKEDARLLIIEEETLSSMLRDRVEISARIIKGLVSRLDQANRKLEILLMYTEARMDLDDDSRPAQAAALATPAPAPDSATSPVVDEDELSELWTNVSEVIIDKDYKTAFELLKRAETLRPDDPKVAKYKEKLADLSRMSEESFGSS